VVMDRVHRQLLLGLIIAIAAALRFYGYWQWSFSNDELSALLRLQFNSFASLIENGVRPDGHPAGTQVFLYYLTKFFGVSETVVRLPFVLAGTLAVIYVYRIGRTWKSDSTGLLMAACFATLEFPLLYSRIARPYALGMLFATMAIYHWARIIRGSQSLKDMIALAVTLAACAYTHYFCALTAALVAFSGLFILKGEILRHYMYALAGAIILFLPHLSTTLHQLSIGGVAWVGIPSNYWPIEHVKFVFNDSILVLGVIGLIAVIGRISSRSDSRNSQWSIPLLLFMLPMAIGFFYSKYASPVLQHSVLLFSFPFLLMFLFSSWNDNRPNFTSLAVLSILAVTLFSTLFQKQFFKTEHFGVFKELASSSVKWKHQFGNDILLIADVNHPYYLDHYCNQLSAPHIRFDTYRVSDEGGLFKLKRLIETSTANHLAYAWSTLNQTPEIERVIKEKYSEVIASEIHFNSGIRLFKKGAVNHRVISAFNFTNTKNWSCDSAMISTVNGTPLTTINSASPYGPTFSAMLTDLRIKANENICVYIEVSMPQNGGDIQMVFEQSNSTDGAIWESRSFSAQLPAGESGWAIFDFMLRPTTDNKVHVKIYPWSTSGDEALITRMEIRAVRGTSDR
jgi:hypothetical protein